MGIKSYEENGKKLWLVYLNLRSKINASIRLQKTVKGFPSEASARREESKIIQELSKKMLIEEGRGNKWFDVINHWNKEVIKGHLGTYSSGTINEYNNIVNCWTKSWLNQVAGEIARHEGRELIKKLQEEGLSIGRIRKIKNTINVIYNFGIEEGIILGVKFSPVYGIKFHKERERVPDILTLEEIRKFLDISKSKKHPWYHIWAGALLTGMRSGEMFALEWDDVDFENELIRVSKSYEKRLKIIKSTKAGYWRNIPISPELKSLLIELKINSESKFVFTHFPDWERGEQSKLLKSFLRENNLSVIKFHALRACFATQLLAKGTPAAIVMKICGWRDLKTMEYYIRVAGVDEKGATDCLKILPLECGLYGNVVQLSDFK